MLPANQSSGGPRLQPLHDLLAQVEEFIRRFVILRDEEACAAALWVVHTHALDAAHATPYIAVTSAEKASGKTRLLEVLRHLVARPWFTGRVSAPALARKVDADGPTLLLDESDAAFGGDKNYSEVLRGILNSGYSRGGAYTVCVGQGANLTARDFSTFGPKAIAGIGKLPDTVASRSIHVKMRRRLASEPVERYRARTVRPEGEAIAETLAVWAENEPMIEALAGAEPKMPDALGDREQDVWEPLIAIADATGGEWPERSRRAALALSGMGDPADATLGVRLLADVRSAFGDTDRLSTSDLLTRLHQLEEAPWRDLNGDNPLSPRRLAGLLRPYEIHSRTIRVEGGSTPKGYHRQQFEDAWARYLSSQNPPQRHNRLGKRKSAPADPPRLGERGVSRTSLKPQEPAVVAAVADFGSEQRPAPNGWTDSLPGCRYPSHRRTDWRNDSGRLVCGICHPRASPPRAQGTS